jgi:hypothetical protein
MLEVTSPEIQIGAAVSGHEAQLDSVTDLKQKLSMLNKSF